MTFPRSQLAGSATVVTLEPRYVSNLCPCAIEGLVARGASYRLKIRCPKGRVGSNPTPGTSFWWSDVSRPDKLRALSPKIPPQDSWTICRWSWCAGPGGDFNGFACPKTLPGPAGTAPRPDPAPGPMKRGLVHLTCRYVPTT